MIPYQNISFARFFFSKSTSRGLNSVQQVRIHKFCVRIYFEVQISFTLKNFLEHCAHNNYWRLISSSSNHAMQEKYFNHLIRTISIAAHRFNLHVKYWLAHARWQCKPEIVCTFDFIRIFSSWKEKPIYVNMQRLQLVTVNHFWIL